MSVTRWACGVDIGGTRISAGLVSDAGELTGLVREPTPRDQGAQATLKRLFALLAQVLADAGTRDIVGIGIGFGGPVDHTDQRIRRSHHAAGWADVQLAQLAGDEFGLPAWIENDANAAGLAEATFGAGTGCDALLYVNVGTGVGGAIILGGRIYHGANSNAGEFGHIVLDPDGPPCTCDKRGCVEALCSGDAIGRMAREQGAHGQQITGRDVGEAAGRGEEWALTIVARAAGHMGLAIAGAVNLLDPDVVVLGGGVPQMGEIYLRPVREAFVGHAVPVAAKHTNILPARLGYEAGVIGAGMVALLEHTATQP